MWRMGIREKRILEGQKVVSVVCLNEHICGGFTMQMFCEVMQRNTKKSVFNPSRIKKITVENTNVLVDVIMNNLN